MTDAAASAGNPGTIAIIGAGSMGRAHARAWAGAGLGDQVAYVCTTRGTTSLDDAPLAASVSDLDAVLADPAVGIVSVCTPTDTHADIAIRALQAGKHVLLEKPIALTVDDAHLIRAQAAISPGVLMVAHVVRFFGGYRAVREAAEAGTLGAPLSVHAERLSGPPKPSPWWHDETRSGGVLVDFAIHDFDQLNLFLGEPVTAFSRRGRPGGPIETTVDYANGGLGHVVTSMGMPPGFSFSSSVEVLGATGLASHRFVGSLDGSPSPQRLEAVGAGTESLATTIDAGDPYVRQAEYFLDCIATGSAPVWCPTDAAVTALAVALAAQESLATGRPVPVTRTPTA
ncbi:Gfo/Idh/MocA family protein [Plantibacter sp. Mn2098]|uniref:Gfo/Idh/MocA family protein n=1 Tax=Plantibacter sp. Mn2098 TaxID=3395266 RepID=UPI003BC1AD86